MAELRNLVQHDSLGAAGEGTYTAWKANKLGYAITMDFFTQMAIEGRVYQVIAGTISLPATGDVPLADAAAEMCADAALGTTIIPAYACIAQEAGGTVNETAGKSVATASTVGDVFVPLNLKSGGPAATSTARVDETGGVTVTAELATTTLRHFSQSQVAASGAGPNTTFQWTPRTPPVLVGPRCFYIQVGATGTGSEYFGNFDYIELPTANIS